MFVFFQWFLIVVVILFGLFNILMSYFAAHDNCEGAAAGLGIAAGAFCLGMGAIFICLMFN